MASKSESKFSIFYVSIFQLFTKQRHRQIRVKGCYYGLPAAAELFNRFKLTFALVPDKHTDTRLDGVVCFSSSKQTELTDYFCDSSRRNSSERLLHRVHLSFTPH